MKFFLLVCLLFIPTISNAGKTFVVDNQKIEIIPEKTFRQKNSFVFTYRDQLVTESILLSCKNDTMAIIGNLIMNHQSDYDVALKNNLSQKSMSFYFDRKGRSMFKNAELKNYIKSECKKPADRSEKLYISVAGNDKNEEVAFALLNTLNSSANKVEAWVEWYKYKKIISKKEDGTPFLDAQNNPITYFVVTDTKTSTSKYQVLCSKMKFSIPTSVDYSESGEPKVSSAENDSKYYDIIPNTIGEQIYEGICAF